MKSSIASRVIQTGTILVATLVLIVVSGMFDFIARDGQIDRKVLGTLVVYWLLCCIGILLITNVRRMWRELILLVFSIMVTLTIAELGLRIFSPFEAMMRFRLVHSREYHHLNPKNKEMNGWTYGGKQFIVKTNEDGLRSKYSRQEFLKYKERIMILGDSFTFGAGVRQELTFPEVTEKLLREHFNRDDIAICNAGVISYSPMTEDLLFSGCLVNYEPTIVLLFLDATDIGDDYQCAKEMKKDSDGVRLDTGDEENEAEYNGALYELASPYVQKVIGYIEYPYYFVRKPQPKKEEYNYYNFELNIGGVVERNRFFIYRHPLELTRPYFMNTLRNISHIAETVHKSGGQFVLVITPRFHHWNPKECPNNWEKGAYSLNEPFSYEYFRFFEEIKGELNYNVFNLLPAFKETKEFPLVFDNDPHWNEGGHAFVARVIANYLVENHCIE